MATNKRYLGSGAIVDVASTFFYSGGSLQDLVDEAATVAKVAVVSTGFTATTNNCYWVALAFLPDDVFVNDFRGSHFPNAAAMISTTHVSRVLTAAIAWAYDATAQRLYVHAKNGVAPTSVSAVKYAVVQLPEGDVLQPVGLKSGVHLKGMGTSRTALINSGVMNGEAGQAPVHTIKAARLARISEMDILLRDVDTANDFGITTLLFTRSGVYDCFVAENVRIFNHANAGINSRQNAVDMMAGEHAGGRANGVLYINCEIEAPIGGNSVETDSQSFIGWAVFHGGKLIGYPWLDGAENSFILVGTEITNVRPSGETVGYLAGVEFLVSGFMMGSLAKHAAFDFMYHLIGVQFNLVTPPGLAVLPLMSGFNLPGKILLEGVVATSDVGPIPERIGPTPWLTAQELSSYYVKNSLLLPFMVASLNPSLRIPMACTVLCTTSVQSTPAGAVLSGFRVSADELDKNWCFAATFTGSLGANGNNKRILVECGIVGSLTTVLDTTALALNGGQWRVRVEGRKADGTVYIAVEFNSSNASLRQLYSAATYTPTSTQDMQLQIKGFAASADLVLAKAEVQDGKAA